MEMKPEKKSLYNRLHDIVIGGGRNIFDPAVFHNMSLIAFFAWVGLGADGLSSSSYGPEEAFLALQGHTHLALFVALGTGITVFVISASYSQIIELFPTGGGGYLVASKLLSPTVGMVSGCALMIDYVLTIAISVASGADAVFSFLPGGVYLYKLWFGALIVVVLTVMNMRGVKESIAPLIPIFMIFLFTHVFFIVYALGSHIGNVPELIGTTHTEMQQTQAELGWWGMIFLILRAYSMGAGTYTGIEAVSNGMSLLREPKVKTGKRTMQYMAVSLAFMVVGLLFAYLLFDVHHVPGKTLNAVLYENVTAGWGSGPASALVLVTLISEAVLLFVAAQTGFLGGPRVLANMALDRWFPTKFSMLSNRLVSQKGIIMMGGAALVTMLLTRGSVKFLVVLYSINVFITFLLSQLGMVRHWWQEKAKKERWKKGFVINGIGTLLTAFILVSVTVIKFDEGGWITIIITCALIGISLLIKKHYLNTAKVLKRLDFLVDATGTYKTDGAEEGLKKPEYDKNAKTAVLLVNGYNGLGLHTMLNVIRLFGGTFRNFVFVQVGIIDAGTFKGTEELEHLQRKVHEDLNLYVNLVSRKGYYAEAISSVGIDVVEEIAKITPKIQERFPQAVFFGGQLVFPNPSIFTGVLHNYTIFAVQRYFYTQGIPIVMMPIRV
ncbi:MAG TPA: APC family permease [Nitrospirota bacterium]